MFILIGPEQNFFDCHKQLAMLEYEEIQEATFNGCVLAHTYMSEYYFKLESIVYFIFKIRDIYMDNSYM